MISTIALYSFEKGRQIIGWKITYILFQEYFKYKVLSIAYCIYLLIFHKFQGIAHSKDLCALHLIEIIPSTQSFET
jgi:hypothetical protein